MNQSRDERYKLIEREHPELSLTVQAGLLGLSRASLYYVPVEPSDKKIEINHRIDELYTAHPILGSRKMAAILSQEGLSISRPTAQKYMREMGIAAIAPGPSLSKRSKGHKIYPYLLRGLKIERPNQVWGIDITYIRMLKGWMYLVAILDWFSRYVVSWELDQTLEIPFVLQSLDQALEQARPEIVNSDQGSQVTSQEYIRCLKTAGVRISMDGRGRFLDNIFTERLWRTIKYEEVYLNEYLTPRETRQGLRRYLHFYNYERPHQSLDYRTPAQTYFDDPMTLKRFPKERKCKGFIPRSV